MVPALDPGIEIYVRNKRPADMATFRPERTLLFVHGATYPAHTTFDLKLDGLSWMDYIAARGYDVYLLDLRGYGKSTRPKEMAQKPDANPPIVRTNTAVKDISAVVDFILKRRNIPRLVLLAGRGAPSQRRPTRSPTRTRSNVSSFIRRSGSARPAGSSNRFKPHRRLPHRDARTGAHAVVCRRARGKEGRRYPGERLRNLGGCDLGHRSGWRQARSAGHPRAQRHRAGLRRNLVGRQALLRSGEDQSAGVTDHGRMGSPMCPLRWRGRCFHCSSIHRASASSNWPKVRTAS